MAVCTSLILVILLCCIRLEGISGANVLAVFPLPFHSHLKTFQPFLEEILKRGHSLTLLSSLPLNVDDELSQNFTLVHVEKYNSIMAFGNWSKLLDNSMQRNEFLRLLSGLEENFDFVENMIKDPAVQELCRSKNSYDLVIVELFVPEVFLTFGNKFNAPVISVTSQTLFSFHKWILGNPDTLYFPDWLSESTENMSLISRTITTARNLFLRLYYEFYHLPRQQTLIDKYIHLEKSNVPTLKEMLMNISVSFVNTHHSLGYVEPFLPNIVNIAGIHFTPAKPLPQDLQKFMGEAKGGVIYLSLGSLIDPNSLESLGKLLINVVKELPQRIIMKWNRELLPQVPSNVLVREWLPQSDILNHPNCRLFITHGGYSSLLESLNATVPVVGVPFFGDQPYNMAMVEYFELGKKTELKNIASNLLENVNEVLNNPKYKQNMEKRSSVFRNRLATPMDTAMFWVDYVLKHKDTSYLKSASSRLKWYESYALDVFGILLVLMGATFYTLKFILLRFISSTLLLFRKIKACCNIKSRRKVTKNNSKND